MAGIWQLFTQFTKKSSYFIRLLWKIWDNLFTESIPARIHATQRRIWRIVVKPPPLSHACCSCWRVSIREKPASFSSPDLSPFLLSHLNSSRYTLFSTQGEQKRFTDFYIFIEYSLECITTGVKLFPFPGLLFSCVLCLYTLGWWWFSHSFLFFLSFFFNETPAKCSCRDEYFFRTREIFTCEVSHSDLNSPSV